MTRLREIELHLDGSFPKELKHAYLLGARTLGGFLERCLASAEAPSTIYRFNVFCTQVPERVQTPYRGDGIGTVHVLREVQPESTLGFQGWQEQYMAVLLGAVADYEERWGLPGDFVRACVGKFREGGYVHEWIQDDRQWRAGKVHSKVLGEVVGGRMKLAHHVTFEGSHYVCEIANVLAREQLYFPFLGRVTLARSGKLEYRAKGQVIAEFDLSTRAFEVLRRSDC